MKEDAYESAAFAAALARSRAREQVRRAPRVKYYIRQRAAVMIAEDRRNLTPPRHLVLLRAFRAFPNHGSKSREA